MSCNLLWYPGDWGLTACSCRCFLGAAVIVSMPGILKVIWWMLAMGEGVAGLHATQLKACNAQLHASCAVSTPVSVYEPASCG